MSPGSAQAQLVAEASLIIWDEAPMMSKHCVESLDRSLSDIRKGAGNRPFGGKVVVFGGDFRQVLPIIPNAGRAEICMSALNASYLLKHCKLLRLTKNMRLLANNLSPTTAKEIKDFSEWILKVGDGKISQPNDGEVMIDIPEEFLITWQMILLRAILCPTNDDVGIINEYMLDQLENPNGGHIVFGGFDPNHFRGEHTYVPMMLPSNWFSKIRMSQILIGNITVDLSAKESITILDSEMTDIYGPRTAVRKIYEALETKTKIVACGKVPKLPAISFTIGEKLFPLTKDDVPCDVNHPRIGFAEAAV
ncbi:PREDICTED: uncharacterized protein LOC104704759 [Camelina sativa]|uniref:ATP-dependent DNA helicase n=1 Tax=Camelina sativa TaxID=90675 RepID=A0ABM0T0U3_CAMSA|nr:PREDICTED: uncharacterized protein LOC104704759 [Camelina sativa]